MRLLCCQSTNELPVCAEPARQTCSGCHKPICLRHRIISAADQEPGEYGLSVWRHVCLTCYAVEQHTRKPIASVPYPERLGYLHSLDGRIHCGPWELFVFGPEGPLRSEPPPRSVAGEHSLDEDGPQNQQ